MLVDRVGRVGRLLLFVAVVVAVAVAVAVVNAGRSSVVVAVASVPVVPAVVAVAAVVAAAVVAVSALSVVVGREGRSSSCAATRVTVKVSSSRASKTAGRLPSLPRESLIGVSDRSRVQAGGCNASTGRVIIRSHGTNIYTELETGTEQ